MAASATSLNQPQGRCLPLTLSNHPTQELAAALGTPCPGSSWFLCDLRPAHSVILHPCISGNRASLQGAEVAFWGWMKTAPARSLSPAARGAAAAGSCPGPEGDALSRARGGMPCPRPGGRCPVPGPEGSAGAGAVQGAVRAAGTPPAVPQLRRPAPGAQVSLGVGCARCHGGGCEGRPGGPAGGRGLRGAGRGLGEPLGHSPGRERGPGPPAFRFHLGGFRALEGLGQPGFVRGAVPAGTGNTWNSRGSAATPVRSLECRARGLLLVAAVPGKSAFASHLPSCPAGLPPRPGRCDVGGRGFAAPRLGHAGARVWCAGYLAASPAPVLSGAAGTEGEPNSTALREHQAELGRGSFQTERMRKPSTASWGAFSSQSSSDT